MSKLEKLEVENIQTYELKPFEKNPRKNEKAIAAVAESIEAFGFNQPILVDQNNRIAAGHTRWEAAKLLNLYSVPCVRRTMTEAEFIAYNIADNKTGEIADWDKKSLGECLHILDDLSALDVPGFTNDEIDRLFGVQNVKESKTPAAASFGSGEVVSEEPDDNARVKNLKFAFSPSEYRSVNSKLKAIMKESDLGSMAEALIKALDGFKEQQKVVKKKGPVKVSNTKEK